MIPPKWLILVTVAFTVLLLVMAVAETTLWIHYFIDAGEYVALFGLAFILGAGIYLYRQGRLWPSLPVTIPWLIYPIVTQGDEIIDNLTINQMRWIVHIILAVLFAAPIAVVVLAIYSFLKPSEPGTPNVRRWMKLFPGFPQIASGKTREGVCYLSLSLLLLETWVANAYLGTLMIVTLAVTGILFLLYLSATSERPASYVSPFRTEKFALKLLIVGVVFSLGMYLGFKNRPGAYQGSPSAFLDPAQKDSLYSLTLVPIPHDSLNGGVPEQALTVLNHYGEAMTALYRGYHILDRNYTYDYHNELFLRNTPLIPEYRRQGLELVAKARQIAMTADAELTTLEESMPQATPVRALLDEVHSYMDYNLKRAQMLEEMSANFERTKAGLQHAAHLYEGENKMLGTVLMKILEKHRATLQTPEVQAVAGVFVNDSQEIYQAYSSRVVGF